MKMNMTPRAKKLLAGLTAAALTLSMLPATALAAKGYATGGETALRFSNSGITVQEGDYDGYKIDGTEPDHQRRRDLCPVGQLRRRLRHREEGHHRRGAGAGRPDVDLWRQRRPLPATNSTEVTIVAADGTVNTLADTEQNNDETYPGQRQRGERGHQM